MYVYTTCIISIRHNHFINFINIININFIVITTPSPQKNDKDSQGKRLVRAITVESTMQGNKP